MAIESGKMVRVVLTLKVPIGLPAALDPRDWAMACICMNMEGVRCLASMDAQVGSLTPSPSMIVGQ